MDVFSSDTKNSWAIQDDNDELWNLSLPLSLFLFRSVCVQLLSIYLYNIILSRFGGRGDD